MSKIRLTEEKLTSLIEESVYELLKEAETDERLGHFLGNAFQSMKNRWNRFKGDIGAGRNYARYRDRGMDSYDKYGDEAGNMRNFGGREYGDYRYNQAVSRNRNAANQWTDEFGNVTNSRFNNNNTEPQNTTANNKNGNAANNTTPTQNPNTTTNQTDNQSNATTNQTTNQTNNKGQQVTQKQKDANKANTLNQLKQQRNNAALFLQQKGFTKRGGQWIYAKDGSNSPAAVSQYPDIRNANRRYEYYNNKMNMMERQIKLNNIISESVDKVLMNYSKKSKK